ncbi:MAG: DNA-binding transcriptional regulator [Hydrogenophaga sp.]|nr:DNA-binding transcriptional regulator [Hydrogenophaga sp.]
MADSAPVKVVLRAFELLQALNRQPVSTLDMLHRQTGIPKPSIVRLLRTMEAKGFVQHAQQYGAYYLRGEVTTLSSGYHSEPKIVEAAAPLVDALTAEIKWPIAVAVCDGESMVVRYSTIPSSPLSFLHSSINMHLSLVSRSIGRAYLAFCEPEAQAALLQALSQSTREEDAGARDPQALRAVLDTVRAQGYALRDPTVRPVSSTLAIPLFENGRVCAAMGLTWFSSAMSADQAIERYLGPLQAVAAQITQRLQAMEAPVPQAPPRKARKTARKTAPKPPRA